MSDKTQKKISFRGKVIKLDFWNIILLCILAVFALLLIYPLFSLFATGFQNSATGEFSLEHFERFFSRPFFYNTLINSFWITVSTTILAIVIGAPLAYFATVYKIRGKGLLNTLIIISMLSPPFIGAYSWILLGGRNGLLTNFFSNVFGVEFPSIYGFSGILLVLTLRLFPFIYLFTGGALKKVDASLIEAAESLGCTPFKKIATVIMPLVTPSIMAGALLVFMTAFADFGTPMLIGEGFMTMPVLIFREFIGEIGGQANFAAALSILMVLITAIIFLVQKYIVNRKSFTMSSLRPLQAKELTGSKNILIHLYIYIVVGLAIIPQITVIYTSFRATQGSRFIEGFSLESYRRIFSNLGSSITNTYVFGLISIAIVVVLSMFIAYLTIRRKNVLTDVLDSVTMFPFIIPGSVLGITLLLAFNQPPLLLSGSAFILILAFVIRRLPYTLRSSSAILYQISPSTEEAAISLGDSPIKAFFKVTAVMMMPGVLSGAILSWITIINELSASVILHTGRTRTMSVAIYQEVIRASYGPAAALATILTLTTVVSLLIFFKISGKNDISL